MMAMFTVCRGCCGTYEGPTCPGCGIPCTTGSEQIRWGEKSGFERAEIIGRGDSRAEIIGTEQIHWGEKSGAAGNFTRRDVVGNYQEIVGGSPGNFARQDVVGNRDIVGGGGPGHFSRDFIVGAGGGHFSRDEIVGAEATAPPPGTPTPGPAPAAASAPTGMPAFHNDKSMLQKAWEAIGMISFPALIYHGYKRNDDSIWGALGWGVLSIAWPITLPIAIGMGFAKPSADARLKQAARAHGLG